MEQAAEGVAVASVIGYLELELYIPQAHSLKEKRGVVKGTVERIKKKFNASVSEVDAQDSWQRAVIGVAVVGTSSKVVDATLESIVRFIDELYPGLLTTYHKELL